MKKIAVGLVLGIFVALTVQPVQAEELKTLAIIDTAVDSSKIPAIVYEACFTDSKDMACPNGAGFMEGKGAASSPVWPSSITNAVYHGHNVVMSALTTNPKLKIVFVRISDISKSGGSINSPKSLIAAIKWVSDNAVKYSIDAVSISQSGVSTDPITKSKVLHSACTDTTSINAVSQLNAIGVVTFAATGNDGLGNLVGFPACINGVVGVGALGSTAKVKTPQSYTQIIKSTNFGSGLDVVARGEIDVVRYNGTVASFTATSAATPIAAATFLNSGNTTFNNYVLKLNKVSGYPYVTN